MKKPLLRWVAYFAFLWSSWACLMPIRTLKLEVPEEAAQRGDMVTAAYLKTGEVVNFSAKSPARIVGNTVVGDIVAGPGEPPASKSIPLSEVKLVEVRRPDAGLTFLASAGVWALIWVGFLILPI